jgi:four helix bundle protein
MGFKRLEDIRAYQAALEFKREVYRLLKGSPAARGNFRYRDQIMDAASGAPRHVAEGFRRFSIDEFAHYLLIARGSIGETLDEVVDGIDREYFTRAECRRAFELGEEADKLIVALVRSMLPFVSPKSPIRGAYRLRVRRQATRPPLRSREEQPDHGGGTGRPDDPAARGDPEP